MAKKIQERFKVIEIGNKEAKPQEMWAVDAKEAIATGRFKYVGNPAPGDAEWVEKEEAVEDDVEDDVEVTAKEIKSMNTADLTSLVEDEEWEIDGFDDMNLKDKREAVIAIIEGDDEDEE